MLPATRLQPPKVGSQSKSEDGTQSGLSLWEAVPWIILDYDCCQKCGRSGHLRRIGMAASDRHEFIFRLRYLATPA